MTCIDGFYHKESKCLPCSSISDKCLKCNNEGSCEKCSDGFFLNGKTCSACTDNCATCTSAEKCNKCNTGFIPEKDVCVTCGSKIKHCTKCSSDLHCD